MIAKTGTTNLVGGEGPYFTNGDIVRVTWGSKTLHGSKTSSWLCWSTTEKNHSAKFTIGGLADRGSTIFFYLPFNNTSCYFRATQHVFVLHSRE